MKNKYSISSLPQFFESLKEFQSNLCKFVFDSEKRTNVVSFHEKRGEVTKNFPDFLRLLLFGLIFIIFVKNLLVVFILKI